MRNVTLVFGAGHALIMATVLASGCGGDADSAQNGTVTGGQSNAGGTGNATSTGGASAGSGGTTTIGTVDPSLCARPTSELNWTDCSTATEAAPADYPYVVDPTIDSNFCAVQFIVPVASEGTPPTAAELCASTETPTSSGWAARVTLTESTNGDGTAAGRVTLAPELASATVTSVAIAVVEQDTGLGTVEVGAVTKQDDAFVFSLAFVNATYATARFPRLVVTATLSLDCEGTTKSVVSTTALYRCDDSNSMGGSAWISAGDACGECAVICEMAASPIVPPVSHTGEPLSQVIRAQVTRIGQYGSALLLQAQHDGGPARFAYEWFASSGDILWQEKDLVLWAPPPSAGEHLLQVSLLAEDAAAVASSRLRTFPVRGA